MIRLLSLFLCCLVSLPDACQAGSFHVNPVRVELSDSVPTGVLNVSNNGDSPVTIQLQMMAWSQLNGKDLLGATHDVLATPPIFRVKPGMTQIIRIGLLRKADSVTERSYRLLLEEIPPPPGDGFNGLQVALRIGLPVFIKPAAMANQSLLFAASRDAEGPLRLTLKNNGTAHAQLLGLQVYSALQPEQLLIKFDNALYLLPGQQRTLPVFARESLQKAGNRLLIKAQTRAGPVESYANLSGS